MKLQICSLNFLRLIKVKRISMNLFVEKEFLDNFYIDFEDQKYQTILKNLLCQYGERTVYINYDENDFVKLKEIIDSMCNDNGCFIG